MSRPSNLSRALKYIFKYHTCAEPLSKKEKYVCDSILLCRDICPFFKDYGFGCYADNIYDFVKETYGIKKMLADMLGEKI
jgi:hypothetical protein